MQRDINITTLKIKVCVTNRDTEGGGGNKYQLMSYFSILYDRPVKLYSWLIKF